MISVESYHSHHSRHTHPLCFRLLASGFWLLASGFWLLASGFLYPAQIHTAEGEDQEAVKVLDVLNRLNLHHGATEAKNSNEENEENESRDVCCLDPSGLVECLMLKGDLLVEISQAEGKTEQIRLQSMALECFTRASAVSLWLLRQVMGVVVGVVGVVVGVVGVVGVVVVVVVVVVVAGWRCFCGSCWWLLSVAGGCCLVGAVLLDLIGSFFYLEDAARLPY